MDALAKTFEGQEIRAVEQDRAAYVVVADVAKALGYEQTSNLTRLIDDEYLVHHNVRGQDTRMQQHSCVAEPGLYQVLARVRKPKAKSFQKWLFEEVIPEIRKTGSYAADEADELTGRAQRLRTEIDALRSEIQEKQQEIDERQARLDTAKAALDEVAPDKQLTEGDTPKKLNPPGIPTEIASRETQADLADPAAPDIIDAARHLTLRRPLVLLDLETTGVNTETARIVQIAMYRLVGHEGGEPAACPIYPSLVTYVDPQQDIPEAASAVNGITTEDVTGMATFTSLAEDIAQMIEDADLCAYNGASFDIPLLRQEFIRAGWTEVPGPADRKIVDPYLIERRLMPHSLGGAHRRYTGRDLEDAHDADADIRGTWRVLEAQVKRVPEVGEEVTPSDLEDFAKGDYLDLQRKLKRDGDNVLVMFGKHEGSSLRWLRENEPGYLRWMTKTISHLRPHIQDHLSDL